MRSCLYFMTLLLMLCFQQAVASVVAFDNFDGTTAGWTRLPDWDQFSTASALETV